MPFCSGMHHWPTDDPPEIIPVQGATSRSTNLKINSHLLNSSQTDFSIHREKENNTERMSLTLDGENLINYQANGAESQGASAWVTAPVRQ